MNTTKPCSHKFKVISLFLFIVAGTTSSQNTKCPFQYFYHLGDGVTDIGNSVRLLPFGPLLPAARLPYGKTFPGRPTGRWSDGLISIDYTAADLGLPNITPYLAMNPFISYDGVMFSVARSPVLDREFFISRDIVIPHEVAPLSLQISWFKKYLRSVCSNPTDRACSQLVNSFIFFGDIEANDIGYSLVQGKSIDEVKTYVSYITQARIDAGKELIKMGATGVEFTANAPLGCYPYVLTALPSTDPSAYDDLGCLKRVNDLIISKNNDLQQAVNNLTKEFPNVTILYGDYYNVALSVINQTSILGPDENEALKACCGIGGKYNYDSKYFCGSPGVPVCPNPDKYIFWDGLHFTPETYYRIERNLVRLPYRR